MTTPSPASIDKAKGDVTPRILQRKCACGGSVSAGGECQECRKKKGPLQRRAAGSAPDEVPPLVQAVLRSPGQPLDAATRAFMEPRFGHDFSAVKVHTDARAAQSAQAVGALAYTVGRHLVFGESRHAPNTDAGRQLMAHELSHIVQQGGGSESVEVPGNLTVSKPGDEAERDADRMVEGVMGGRGLESEGRPGGAASRNSQMGFAGEPAIGAKTAACPVGPLPNAQLRRKSDGSRSDDGARQAGEASGEASGEESGEASAEGICVCAFKGNYGKLWVDCGCKGSLPLWVIDEDNAPAAGATCGTWLDADGFVLGGTTYKIDGSTCAEITCDGGTPTISACVNTIAYFMGKKPPYPVPPGTFGGPPKEPAPGAPAPVVH